MRQLIMGKGCYYFCRGLNHVQIEGYHDIDSKKIYT